MKFNNKNIVKYNNEILTKNENIRQDSDRVYIMQDDKEVASMTFGPLPYPGVKNITLNRLFVDEDYRGRNYARDLIYFILSQYPELELATLRPYADTPSKKALIPRKDGKPNYMTTEQLKEFYSKFSYGYHSQTKIWFN